MIVLFVFTFLHVLFWNIFKSYRKQLFILSVLVTAYLIFWMIPLEIELNGGTYGTDERRYFMDMQMVARGLSLSSIYAAPWLAQFGSTVLRSSPTNDVIWVRLANIVVYSLAINLIYTLVYPRFANWYQKNNPNMSLSKLDKHFLTTFVIYACNGVIVWTVLRVLKETLLILLIVSSLYAIDLMFKKTSRMLQRMFGITLLIGSTWMLSELRSGGEFIIIIVFFALMLKEFGSRDSIFHQNIFFRIIFLSFSIVAFIGAVNWLEPQIAAQIKYTQMFEQTFGNYYNETLTISLKSSGIWGYLLSFLRFVLGPGPIRALQQIIEGDVFVFSTRTGDVLIFLGALQWWITLALVCFNLLVSRRPIWRFQQILAIVFGFTSVVAIHIGSYVYLYAGTGDTRHRAVMYVLLTPLLLCLGDFSVSANHHLSQSGDQPGMTMRNQGNPLPIKIQPITCET